MLHFPIPFRSNFPPHLSYPCLFLFSVHVDVVVVVVVLGVGAGVAEWQYSRVAEWQSGERVECVKSCLR